MTALNVSLEEQLRMHEAELCGWCEWFVVYPDGECKNPHCLHDGLVLNERRP